MPKRRHESTFIYFEAYCSLPNKDYGERGMNIDIGWLDAAEEDDTEHLELGGEG